MHWALKSKKEPMLKASEDTPEFHACQLETQVPIEGIPTDENSFSSNFNTQYCPNVISLKNFSIMVLNIHCLLMSLIILMFYFP